MGLLGLFGLIGNAWAIDIGTISVTGTVSAGSCTARISGSTDHTIALDTVSPAALAAAGNTAAPKTFTISLSGCDLVGNKNVVPYFLGASINTAGRLNNMHGTGAAANVELQMLNASSALMDLSQSSGSQNAGVVNIPITPNGSGSMTYTLRYYATAAATAGLVSSSMTWGVDYN